MKQISETSAPDDEESIDVAASDYEGCTRAFNTFALAHDCVAKKLRVALQDAADLALVEFDLLIALQGRKSVVLSSLLPDVNLSQPALSRLVARLEARDLVRRYADQEDQRVWRVELTKRGQALLQRAIPVHSHCIQTYLLKRLTQAERDALRRILHKIADGCENDNAG